MALPPDVRRVLAHLLHDLSLDARECAQQSWRRNKAPMAFYWKVVSVYAGHLHRLLRATKAEMAGHVPEPLPGRAPTRAREGA